MMAMLLAALPLLADQKAGEELKWQATAGGGSDHATNGTYVLSSTVGQATAGAGDNGTYVLNLGYQQNFSTETAEYICGDADASGIVNITDAIYLIQYIFNSGPPPDPMARADSDCSGVVDMSDVVYLVQFIFADGPFPCDPSGDGTPDC